MKTNKTKGPSFGEEEIAINKTEGPSFGEEGIAINKTEGPSFGEEERYADGAEGLFNVGKSLWNIYYEGAQMTSPDKDYAAAIPDSLVYPNKKIIKGPYECSIKNVHFSYLVSFSTSGERYITRAAVLIKHSRVLRANKASINCRVEKIYKDGGESCVHLSLEFYSPSAGGAAWKNDINIRGGGGCETIDFYEAAK